MKISDEIINRVINITTKEESETKPLRQKLVIPALNTLFILINNIIIIITRMNLFYHHEQFYHFAYL
jgi:hypothetical protein